MKTNLSIIRSEQLHKKAQEIEKHLHKIPSGMEQEQIDAVSMRTKKIMEYLAANEDDWNNWNWQLKHRIQNVEQLKELLRLSPKQQNDIQTVAQHYRFAISPYYLSLIDTDAPFNYVGAMSIPSTMELNDCGISDPSAEENTNPAGKVIRRYPNRVIINITNCCASYCRHCQRKRNIDAYEQKITDFELKESLQYIKEHTEIHDVLITGGDSLTLSDQQLEHILFALREIPHVDIIRLGSRMLVNLPQRITSALISVLKKYAPIYLNTQFNHPIEITPTSFMVCECLADAGIILGNQMVLLKGINDDKYTVQKLNQLLLKMRVRPYYIFHAKNVKGAMHFQTPIKKGIEILSYLQGNTSGLAIPKYIISAPEGLGKIPISEDTILRERNGVFELTTWEGRSVCIPNLQ